MDPAHWRYGVLTAADRPSALQFHSSVPKSSTIGSISTLDSSH